LFFVANKATTTSLLPSQNFPLLPTSPLPTSLLPIYLTSFYSHSIVQVWESLKREGKRGRP
jgi:hypothetical protein